MSEMDDPALRARLDPDGAYALVHGLPRHCEEAWLATRKLSLPAGYAEINRIVVAGMGGSAIAGDFLRALAFEESEVEVTVVRGYDLPRWLDDRTLIVACSHSGNTEETLSAFAAALKTPARKVVITTGGRLAEMAAAADVPALTYAFPPLPRAAFGHAFTRLLAIAQAAGALAVTDASIAEAVAAVETVRSKIAADVPESNNPAKALARRLRGRLPLMIGAGFVAPVASRWRTQLNENADHFAFWDELPELDHNLVVGLLHDAELVRATHAVFLDHESLSPRIRLRYGPTIRLFEGAGMTVERFVIPEKSRLAAQFAAVHFGDFVSFYLGMLNGARPAENDNIDWLKEQLAKKGSVISDE